MAVRGCACEKIFFFFIAVDQFLECDTVGEYDKFGYAVVGPR